MDFFAFFNSSKYNRVDRTLVTLSLLSSFTFLYLLMRHKDENFQRDLRPLAKIESNGGKLRRKLANSLTWTEISNKGILYQGDEVFNELSTYARISFLSKKNVITLPPNSLICIDEKDGKTTLEVKEGQIEIAFDKNEKIDIKNGEKVYNLTSKNSSKIVISNAAGEISVSSKAGIAFIQNGNKTTEIINDQVIVVKKELKVNKIKILSPYNNQQIDVNNTVPEIELAQKINGKIVVSHGSTFSEIVFEKKITNENKININELSEGDYSFKIIENNEESEIRSFRLVNSVDFVPLSPLEGETQTLRNPTDEITLTWKALMPGTIVDIQIDNLEHESGKPSFIQSSINNNNSLKVSGLRGSAFSWKGRITAKGKSSKFSKSNNVKLSFPMAIAIKAELPQSFSSYKDVSIKWEKRTNNEKFLVKLTKDKVVTENVTDSNQWSFNKVKSGVYDFELNSLTFPTENSLYKKKITISNPVFVWLSKPVLLEYSSFTPILKLDLKIQKLDAGPIRINVKSISLKSESEVMLGSDNQLIIKGYGKYCINGKGRAEAYFLKTEDYCFTFSEAKRSSIPIVEIDQVMKRLAGNKDIYKITVPVFVDSIKYDFKVYSDKLGRKKIYERVSTGPQLLWKSSQDGIYYFKYRVIDKLGVKSDFTSVSQVMFPISPFSDWFFRNDDDSNKLKYVTFDYVIAQDDTIFNLIKKFSRPELIAYKKSPFIVKLLRLNPKISNWKMLEPNGKVLLCFPEEFFDLDAYKLYETQMLNDLKLYEEKLSKEESLNLPARKMTSNSFVKDDNGDFVNKLDSAIVQRYAELNAFSVNQKKEKALEKEAAAKKEIAIAQEKERVARNEISLALEKDKLAKIEKEKTEQLEKEKVLQREKDLEKVRVLAAENALKLKLAKEQERLAEVARLKSLKEQARLKAIAAKEEEERWASAKYALSEIDTVAIYIVKSGDTFESISNEIYGTPKRALEIQELNKSKTKKDIPEEGLRLIYVKR